MKRLPVYFLVLIVTLVSLAIACGGSPAPAAPAPAQPAIDPAELSKLVQDAVKQSVPEQQAAPAPVSAQEIQRMVEAAVTAAAPEGASPEEISAMVQQAVQASAQPGVSKEDVENLVTRAVSDAAAASQPGVSASEVEKIVSEAIRAIPTAAPVEVVKEVVVVATPVRAAREATYVMRAPEPNPKRGGNMKTAFGVTMTNFDVQQGAGAHVLGHLYNKVVTKNLADGLRTIAPDLAVSWEAAPDGMGYTFNLRDGVTYSDGTPFSADDVVANFTRIIDPPAGVSSRSKDLLPMIDSVEKVDDYTATFNLNAPTPYFVELLTSSPLLVYSKKSLEENNYDLRKIEVAPGTGVFRFVDHIPGEKWEFEANPDYWNPELPYLDGLTMLHVPTWPDRGAAVLTGQADFSWNISPDTHAEAKRRQDIGAVTYDCLNSHNFAINNERAPFDDPRVRRAIHLAVSRQTQIDGYTPVWEPTFVTRWIPKPSPFSTDPNAILQMPGYRAEKEEDIAEAKRLLAEAGYPDGFEMTITTWNLPTTAEVAVPLFVDELRKTLNIQADIKLVERALQSEILHDGNFDMFRNGDYAGQILDPFPMWNIYLRTGGSQNWSRYANPEFDAVLDRLAGELDPFARAELFNEGMDILDANPPFYHIGFCGHSPAWSKDVKGMSMETRLHVLWERLDTVWLDR